MRTVESSSSSDMIVHSQVQTTAAAAAPSPKSPPKETQMPNLESFAAKLNNFAVVLSEKAKSHPVIVGNVGDIEAAVNMKKVCVCVCCCFDLTTYHNYIPSSRELSRLFHGKSCHNECRTWLL